MKFREKFIKLAQEAYKMDKDELIKRLEIAIENIQSMIGMVNTAKDITIEVLAAIKYSLKHGIRKSNINREKIKIAMKILKELATLDAKNEDEKKFIEFVAKMAENYMDSQTDIPHKRNNGRW